MLLCIDCSDLVLKILFYHLLLSNHETTKKIEYGSYDINYYY